MNHATGVVIGQAAVVGKDCVIFHGVTLGGVAMVKGKRHPTLGDKVMVGAGAKVLEAVSIGDDCKIGANAVVTKSMLMVKLLWVFLLNAPESSEKAKKRRYYC